MLAAAGRRPGFIIGGDVADVGTGAEWTGSDWFVVEADESDGTHSHLPLVGTVLTNIDRDHLDHFGSFAALVESFSDYLDRVAGPRVVCLDDPVAEPLARRPDCVSYGLHPESRYRVVDVVASEGRQDFAVEHPGGRTQVRLPLRGVHNAVNATGALALAVEIGVDPDVAARALGAFGGVARRFDIRAVDGGATFVDDYAHLPAEIAAVLAAARHSGDGWRRVIAVFQPNRFNRMSEIWRDYAECFADADLVVLTDIYSSGTTPIPGVTGKLVVNAVTEADPTRRVVWMRQREDLIRFLAAEVGEGDVCISMGCGDIASLPDEVVEARMRSGRGSAA
jgi:UDP-N-acetylmuramate--alanine ligase